MATEEGSSEAAGLIVKYFGDSNFLVAAVCGDVFTADLRYVVWDPPEVSKQALSRTNEWPWSNARMPFACLVQLWVC